MPTVDAAVNVGPQNKDEETIQPSWSHKVRVIRAASLELGKTKSKNITNKGNNET